MLIVAIDVGIKNLGYCAMRSEPDKAYDVIEWANEQLTDGVYQPMKNVDYIHSFVQRHAHLLHAAQLIVIERQMRVNMRIIEAVLHALHYDRCVVVQARTVKAHYGLCMRNYRLNKLAAVDHVHKLLEATDSDWLPTFLSARKKDDLADAFLMAHFFSTQATSKWCTCPTKSETMTTSSTRPRSPSSAADAQDTTTASSTSTSVT